MESVGIDCYNINLDNYTIIDIRSKQAFISESLKDSYNLGNVSEILEFITTHCNKPILLVCFSSINAKKMSIALLDNKNFIESYKFTKVYYLTCGIMELFDNESANLRISNTPHNNTISPFISQTMQTIKEQFLSSKKAWVVTFSGGKDSTCVLQLVYEMLANLPKQHQRKVFAIASNTLVEAPHINRFLKSVIASINTHAKQNNIPFEIIEVSPSLKDDFWVNLIGKGYPSPTRTFRWCTDRLKITPAKDEVAKITAQYGSCILLLGTRKAESQNRKRSIEKRILNDDGYAQHNDFPNTLTYSPIVDWDTDMVWGYLLSHKPLWEKDHSELFSLYAKASGDECQFITDLRQNSCGGSRFGCWVCTVVNEDKSMQGFIDTGEKHLTPLNDFRNFIKDLREDSNARADYKRDGKAVYKVGRLGPFLSQTRIRILTRLLETEMEFKKNGGENLIEDSQILAIQKEWNKDFDLNETAILIAKQFNRLKEVVMTKTKVLHKELLKNLGDDNISANELENIISKSIEIVNNHSLKGKNNAGSQIKDIIAKFVQDKTAKEENLNVYS